MFTVIFLSCFFTLLTLLVVANVLVLLKTIEFLMKLVKRVEQIEAAFEGEFENLVESPKPEPESGLMDITTPGPKSA